MAHCMLIVYTHIDTGLHNCISVNERNKIIIHILHYILQTIELIELIV